MIKNFSQGNIQKQLRTLALPAFIGYLFHTLYNVTDTYFAGLISTDALAAVTFAFPIFFFLLSISIGMSEGLTALVANKLGAKSLSKAAILSKNGLLFSLILAIIVTLIGLILTAPLLKIVGAKGEVYVLAYSFTNLIIVANFFVTIGMFINALLNATGDMESFKKSLIFSFFLNIILNYLFWKMGVGLDGIAYGTIVSEALVTLYLGYKLLQTKLVAEKFVLDRDFMTQIIKQGIPPSFNMAFMALGAYIMTYYASLYSKEVVAMLGIGMRIEQMAIMPMVGINAALLSIASHNVGAKEFMRVKDALKFALLDTLYVSLFFCIVIWLFAQELISLFTTDPLVIVEGITFLHVESLILFAFGVIFIFVALLQAIEKPKFIFYLSLLRQIVVPVIIIEIVRQFSDNVLYLWLSIAFSVVLAAFVVWKYSVKELNLAQEKSVTKRV